MAHRAMREYTPIVSGVQGSSADPAVPMWNFCALLHYLGAIFGSWTAAMNRRCLPFANCERCGGIVRPMAVLDSRKGKKLRLLRCFSREKLSRAEDYGAGCGCNVDA